MKKMITALSIILTITIIAVALPLVCYMVVKQSTKERIYSNVEEIPANRVGLVLGTSPTVKSGKSNYYSSIG